MILFETTASVFELLWDIALAVFIIRLAFYYFALSFSFGILLAMIRLFYMMPVYQLTQPEAELIAMPVFLLTIVLCARFLIVRYEIPRIGGFRLAIGYLALVFMLIGELIGGVVMYEEGWREWYWETDSIAFGTFCVVMLFFATMPWILMIVETDEMGETSHGHERKSLTDAM